MNRRKEPPRQLSGEERKLWQQIAEQVAPIKKKPRREEAPPPPAKPARLPHPHLETKPPVMPVRQASRPKQGLDAHTMTRIQEGKQRYEGRIDLHGMTEDQAYTHLKSALALAYEKEARLVLVITGKGRGGEGLLKRRVPHWLEDDCAAVVTAYASALQKDGGAGALYVTLRRKRN